MNGTREVVFFDTRYAFKKLDYRIGETYKFKLGAFAYCVEMLDNPKMKLTAEQAEDFAQRTGGEVKRYGNGKARPMSIDMRDMAACISRGGAHPDNCLANDGYPVKAVARIVRRPFFIRFRPTATLPVFPIIATTNPFQDFHLAKPR